MHQSEVLHQLRLWLCGKNSTIKRYQRQQPKFGDRSAVFQRRLHEQKGKYLRFMLGADYGSCE